MEDDPVDGEANQSQPIQLPSDGNPAASQMIPIEVSGGRYETAHFGPMTNSETRNVGIAGGHFPGAHIGPRYDVVVNTTNGSSHGNEPSQPTCLKHAGKNCGKLPGSICLFRNEKLSTAPKSKVYGGAKTSGVCHDQPLAIKLIQDYSDKNRREALNLMKLRPHQNVVTILQADVCSQAPVKCMFIAMELCSTVNLETYIEKRKKRNVPFNVKQAFAYSKQIIEAIAHIHRNEIVHRDLKPSSVLFSLCGNFLKICDFGVSKELKHGRSVMSLSMLKLGTDGYRAPETYNKELITKMADIFSLALVLHHLMSYGYHPFGLDTEEWNLNIKKGRNLNLSRLRVPFLEIAKDFFKKMLKFRPTDRPSIEEVMGEFFKLDWLSSLMRDFVEIWGGTIKDNTGADVLPCQLYCSLTKKEVVEIDGAEWKFHMETSNLLNIGSLKKVTDEEPAGYIVTSSKEEVKKLIDKLGKNNLMAWIDISKEGKEEKVLVLVSYQDYPELFGFFFPNRQVVSSHLGKLVSQQRKQGVQNRPAGQRLFNTPMNVPTQGQGSSTAQNVASSQTEPSAEEAKQSSHDDCPETQPSASSESQPRQGLTTNKEFIPWWIIS